MDQAQKQGSACPWKLPGFPDRKHTEAGPSKLSGRRSGLDPRVLNRSRPSRATRHPRRGLPPPQELAARLERHQVSGRISISAPFHGKRGHRRHQIPQNFPHDLRPSAGAIFSVPHPYRVSQVRFLPGEQGCRGKQVRTYLRPQVRPLWAAARPHRPSRRLPPSAVVRWCRRADPGRISRAPRGRGPRGVRAARSARCCRRTAGSGRRPRRPTRASAWRPPSAPAFASRPPRSRSRALPCS